jgi:transportin-3
VVELVWPTLSTCLRKYHDDAKIIESCCRALRFVLRCTEKYSQTILIDVVNSIVSSYQANHFSCFLYLGSILVDIYGTEDSFKSGLIEMMQAFTKDAFDFIIKNCESVENIDELRKHPDTIDDMFRLSLRFLQRCPYEFINSPIFSPIMLLAVTSLNLDHRDANLSVTKFLSEFIALSHKPQIKVCALRCNHNNSLVFNLKFLFEKGLNETNASLINRVLNEIGEKMIENTINSTINMTTRDTKDGIADVLSELLITNRKV